MYIYLYRNTENRNVHCIEARENELGRVLSLNGFRRTGFREESIIFFSLIIFPSHERSGCSNSVQHPLEIVRALFNETIPGSINGYKSKPSSSLFPLIRAIAERSCAATRAYRTKRICLGKSVRFATARVRAVFQVTRNNGIPKTGPHSSD